mgnify:CR=1 FL=1
MHRRCIEMIKTTQFHSCNARVTRYKMDGVPYYEEFISYSTPICVTANVGKKIYVWMRVGATHLSRSTTTQVCRYIGELAGVKRIPVSVLRTAMSVCMGTSATLTFEDTEFSFPGGIESFTHEALRAAVRRENA